jgi:hypothetical protein
MQRKETRAAGSVAALGFCIGISSQDEIDPESCAVAREGIGEALTGDRTGQPLSRKSTLFPGADVVPLTEGNMDGHGIASAQTARRGRRHWHVRTLLAQEPGDPTSDHRRVAGLVRIGKALDDQPRSSSVEANSRA